MSRYIIGTRTQAETAQAIGRKLGGYPLRGRHVGGGRHATIPPSPPGPGWTTELTHVRQHPTLRTQWACHIPDAWAALVADSGARARLAAGELTLAESLDATAAELDASWTEVGP